jgi:tetratricopeptide (TPR) repeat protein
LRIDSVILIPATAEDPGMSGEPIPFLVGVLIEGEIYLFDPRLGIPIPGPNSGEGIVRPATFKQVQAQPELLSGLGSEDKPYPLTSAELAQPAVLFVGDLSYYSSSARVLQQVFAGEHSVLISDPLEDVGNVPGLWSRLIAGGKGIWTADALRLWKYPQDQVTRSLALDDEAKDRRKSLKLRFMAYLTATPIPEMPGKFVVSGSKESRDPTQKGLDSRDAGVGGFARTESRTTSGRQMEGRLAQVAGNLSEALRAYVEVQSNSREILQIPDNNLLMDKRLGPINVKLFHALAIDDAVYWSGLCQLEQGQYGPAANTFDRYLRQANRVSEWTRQARRMKGVALAAQGKFAEAAQSLGEISEDDPEAPGLRQLAKAWRAAAGS